MDSAQRSCMPCAACCDYPAIPALDKQEYTLCQHASSAGCGIYATRPTPCQSYRCLWIEGELEDDDRPDKIGLALDQPTLIAEHPDYAGVQVVCVRELWPNAKQGERASELLRRLSRAMVVRVVAHGGHTKVMGPQKLMALVMQRAAERKASQG